nr:hypothetical protein [Tanacetum cinerariifolium]
MDKLTWNGLYLIGAFFGMNSATVVSFELKRETVLKHLQVWSLSDSKVVNDGPSKGKVPKDVNDGPSKGKFPKGVNDGPPPEFLRWNGYADVSSSDSLPFSTDEETSEDETTNKKKITVGTTGKNQLFNKDTKYIPVRKSAGQKAIKK